MSLLDQAREAKQVIDRWDASVGVGMSLEVRDALVEHVLLTEAFFEDMNRRTSDALLDSLERLRR